MNVVQQIYVIFSLRNTKLNTNLEIYRKILLVGNELFIPKGKNFQSRAYNFSNISKIVIMREFYSMKESNKKKIRNTQTSRYKSNIKEYHHLKLNNRPLKGALIKDYESVQKSFSG